MFYADIQFNHDPDPTDEACCATFSLALGNQFLPAVEIYTELVKQNTSRIDPVTDLVYIRFRYYVEGEQNIVLSRKTPFGQGDW